MIRGLFNTLTNPAIRKNWRFNALLKLGRWIMPEYRFHWPEMVWWRDQQFNSYLTRFNLLGGANTDRRFMLHQLTKLAQAVPGDTAECGVLEGASSYLISRAFPDRSHFMFDSFEGCSSPGGHDNSFFAKHTLACDENVVRE